MVKIIVCASIILALCVVIVFNNNHISISKFNLKSEKIPKSFDRLKIVHLSDLHSKKFGNGNCKLIKKIDNINPDVIFMTGDMTSKKSCNFYQIIELVKNLSMKYKVYYSFGNHEMAQKYNNLKLLRKKLEQSGAIVLFDKYVDFERNNEKIRIYGFNFRFNMEPRKNETILDEKYVSIIKNSIGKFDKNMYNILLTHDPLNYELYDYIGADLVFSGHVHGGMMRIAGIGILSPRRKFFPKYSAGIYKGKNGKMIVSRGLGNSSFKLRVNNFPDIPVITLLR